MYRISELASQLGLSRSTLLYYEKLGLIRGQRQDNGYRIYSNSDLERLRLLQQLHTAGLSLKESLACLEARIDRELLLNRLQRLEEEITQKQKARDLLSGLLGKTPLREWHQSIENTAPQAHFDWLRKQGFSEKDALRLRWLSKDMNHHEQYVSDFTLLFDGLDRLGPGSTAETTKAINQLPYQPSTILEIGCGKGVSTLVLARLLPGKITATDNDDGVLGVLQERLNEQNLTEKVTVQNASMMSLPYQPNSFELIWAEGCAYIMGFKKALEAWRNVLSDDGLLVVSDLVRSIPENKMKSASYWQDGYPDMTSQATRISQAQAAGYEVLDTFKIEDEAWWDYYKPLEERLNFLKPQLPNSQALKDMEAEISVRRNFGGEFDYAVFVLKKKETQK